VAASSTEQAPVPGGLVRVSIGTVAVGRRAS
jgi:hypothetical protein